jgi:hypothetical protein
MKANDFVAFALKSPLHVMMGDTMLLTVTGRKTGRKISVPVSSYRDGNALWVISSRDRTWWRNLAQGGEVEVRLHGCDLKGYGEVILDWANMSGTSPLQRATSASAWRTVWPTAQISRALQRRDCSSGFVSSGKQVSRPG